MQDWASPYSFNMDNDGTYNPTNVRRNVCYMTIIIWSILAIIGIFYKNISVTLFKATFSLQAQNQFPLMREHLVTSQSIDDFKLQFKTKLYVLNKCWRSADSNFTKLKDLSVSKSSGNATNNSSANGDSPSLQNNGCYTHEVDTKTCQCSEVHNNSFYCSELLPSSGNIFFLEMSCASNHRWDSPEIHLSRTPLLSEKQTCSIYSAAYHNPSRMVILLFTCPIPEGFNLIEEWKVLLDLPNFYLSRVDVAEFYANTFLLEFYHRRLAQSSFPAPHQADIFRLVVLYLYGGTYMDLDVISLRPLNDLGVNFVGHVAFSMVSNSVMNFEPGHGFVRACLFNAILNYEPNRWSSIGPVLVTNTLKSLCNVSEPLDPKSLMLLTSCNVTVLPRNTFFAVMWYRWWYFYKTRFWSVVNKLLNESYAAHYWNHMGHQKLLVGSNQPIIKLAEQHCTPVYKTSGFELS